MDIFESFLENLQHEEPEDSRSVKTRMEYKGQSGTEEPGPDSPPRWFGLPGKRGFEPGMTVNHVRVVEPHVRSGSKGRYSNRQYVVECVAPTGPKGASCGKKGVVTYHQIYYQTIYSCGCLQRPKHPPIRLEGQRIGRVEVLRWTEEHGGTWELLCHECARLLYRKSVAQVRGAGESCASHRKGVVTR